MYCNIINCIIWLLWMTNFLSVTQFIHRLNPVWVKLLCFWVCKAVLTKAQYPMTHSWRNISWCSRMLLSGVSGLLFGIWHRAVGGQAIRSPHCWEIQECCNPGFEICRSSDVSLWEPICCMFVPWKMHLCWSRVERVASRFHPAPHN